MARRALGSGAPCSAGRSCVESWYGLKSILANLQSTHSSGLPRRGMPTTSSGPRWLQKCNFSQAFFGAAKESFEKLLYFGPRQLLGLTCPFSDSNLAPKIHPKSTFFGLQDPSYLKMRQTPKLGDGSKDGPHFCSPRGSRNPPKIE